LVPSSAWDEESNGRVKTPFGKPLSETTTIHALFEGGEMITITKDGSVVFNQFYPRCILDGETKKER